MGVFKVTIKLKNWQNRFLKKEQRGEDIECEALVDSGASELALPAELIERLKLKKTGEVEVYTADGGKHSYRVFGIVDLTVQGRSTQVRVIELPHGTDPLLFVYNNQSLPIAASVQELDRYPLGDWCRLPDCCR